MHQSVRDAMTSNPRTVQPEANVQEPARLMKSENVGAVPIVDGDRLVGVVTDRDIAMKIVAEGKSLDTPVSEIASRDLVTIDPDQSLEEAARLMAEHQLRRLPVVEEDGKLVGIVAQADVAKRASEDRTGEVVEDISK